jgi:ribonuclease P protein component
LKRFSLPKSIILKKKSDFNTVISNGKTFRSDFFRAFYIPGKKLKVGFTVQRGLKDKVKRNHLKRKLRELWRLNFRNYDICGELVIIIKLVALNQDFLSLEKDFKFLLNNLNE